MEGLAPESLGGFVSGMETWDDAGYVPFGGGLFLQTADFFTPVVDDPYRFGQIAAANALSDVYAMGVEPLTALNLVAFPCSLDLGILREILAGGQSKIEESGAKLCGGHSVQDEEPKVSAATDVAGYGFLGHLVEMLEASNAGAVVGRGEVPVWERAVPLADDGVYPGGLKSNREYLAGRVEAEGVGEEALLPLFDPQTSGGLLIAAEAGRAGDLIRLLGQDGVSASVVGRGAGVRVTA